MPARQSNAAAKRIEIQPVTPERWSDLETLFGPNGACAGCWCMWWRLTRAEWTRGQGEKNRAALKALVMSGQEPGLIAYVDGTPAGWCAVAPRAAYPSLDRSPVLGPVDDKPVWSLTCFFIQRRFRKQGLMRPLLDAAVDYARQHGARIVEGYPVDPGEKKVGTISAFTGLASTFAAARFVEVARRPAPPRSSAGSPTRPIMRRRVRPART